MRMCLGRHGKFLVGENELEEVSFSAPGVSWERTDATKCCCPSLGGLLKRSHLKLASLIRSVLSGLCSTEVQGSRGRKQVSKRIKLSVVKEEKAEQRSRGGEVGGLFLGTTSLLCKVQRYCFIFIIF